MGSPGSASGRGSPTSGSPRRSSRRRATGTSRCSRCPTSSRSSRSQSRRSRAWSTSSRRGYSRGFVPSYVDLASRGLALPVGADGPDRGIPQAWLVAVKDSGGLAEIDRLILHQAVTVVALELLRRRVADTTERRLAGDVLTAIMAGELAGADLGRRLEPFGLGGRVTALVLSPPERTTPEAC